MTKDAAGARLIAWRYMENGDKRLKAGDIDLAVQSYERSVSTLERLAREQPEAGSSTNEMAAALNRLGRGQFCASRIQASIASFERALGTTRALESGWADPKDEISTISTEHYLANALRHAGEYDKAEEVVRSALLRARDLANRGQLAGVYSNTVEALERDIKHTGLARNAASQWPPPSSLSEEDRFLSCYYRVLHFANRGDLDVAEKSLAYWISLSPPGNERYNLACGHAILVGALGANSSSDREERRARIDAHKTAALAALGEAIAAGYNDFEHARSDLDFVSLREMPEFKKLVGTK